MEHVNVAIIGGGIVGLATAYQLTDRFPSLQVVVLEKENEPARHQSQHNSGVLHSGIYYQPGSLRATNCRQGKEAMEAFCAEQGIDYDVCGKVIVAIDQAELPIMHRIYERGRENGVKCELIDRERLHELEPHAAGIAGIHVPEAGIVDYRQVCLRLLEIVQQRGGRLVTGARVRKIIDADGSVVLETKRETFTADYVVNCAGLHSDRVSRMSGQGAGVKIVPFRGEFYKLESRAEHFCRGLIYPVPDPNFPFLGVHFTRMIAGGVECGPNAVLAFAREGYRKTDVNLRDLAEALTYGGFLKLGCRHWRVGMAELWRSFSKRAFVKALRRLIPEIRSRDLTPAPSGVRAIAVAADGAIVDDFLIQQTRRVVNVCNAPSPAATASLNVGKIVVDRLATLMD